MDQEPSRTLPATIGIAHCVMPGEIESGDRFVVKIDAERTTMAVIDGLGHGPEAARAAKAAARVIGNHAFEQPTEILRRCHERLRTLRGAAVTLIVYHAVAGRLEWTGAGNVAASLIRRDRWGRLHRNDLLVRAGAVGLSLPSARLMSTAVAGGDYLVMATDGLKPGFLDAVRQLLPPQAFADRLLSEHHRENDDALVLVARFKGRAR